MDVLRSLRNTLVLNAFIRAYSNRRHTRIVDSVGSVFADGEVRLLGGTIRCDTSGFNIGEKVQLLVRAEDLHIQRNGTGEIGGIIDRKIYTGAGVLYHVDVGGCVLKTRSMDEVQKGRRVALRVIRAPTIRRLRDENKTEA